MKLVGVIVVCAVLLFAAAGNAEQENRRALALDHQWKTLMVTGTHAGYSNGALQKQPGKGIVPPTGSAESAPGWPLALSARGIYVSDRTEKRLGGLWLGGGWTLLGGLLKRVDIGDSAIELCGKRVERVDPYFVLSVPLKVVLNNGEVHIHGNRAGLRDLANTCMALSDLSDEQAKTAANHVIFADYMSSADEGSVPLMVCLVVD